MVLPKKPERSRKPTEKAELLLQQHMAPDGTKKLGKPPVILGKRKIRTPLGKGRVSPKPETRRETSRPRKSKPAERARPAAKKAKKEAPASKAKKRQSTPQRGKHASRVQSETEESASESSSMLESEEDEDEQDAMDSLESSDKEEDEGSRESEEAQGGQRSTSDEPEVVSDSGAEEPDAEQRAAEPGNSAPAAQSPSPAAGSVSPPPKAPAPETAATTPSPAAQPAVAKAAPLPTPPRPLSWAGRFGVPSYIAPPTAQASAAACSSNSPAKLALIATPFQPGFLSQTGGSSGSPMRRPGLTPTLGSLLAAKGRDPSLPAAQMFLAPPIAAAMAAMLPAPQAPFVPPASQPAKPSPGAVSHGASGGGGTARSEPAAAPNEPPGMDVEAPLSAQPPPAASAAVPAAPVTAAASSVPVQPAPPAGPGSLAAAAVGGPHGPKLPPRPAHAEAARARRVSPPPASSVPASGKVPAAGPALAPAPVLKSSDQMGSEVMPASAPTLPVAAPAGARAEAPTASGPARADEPPAEAEAVLGHAEAESPAAVGGGERPPPIRTTASPEAAPAPVDAATEAVPMEGVAVSASEDTEAPMTAEPSAAEAEQASSAAEPVVASAPEPEPDPERDEAARVRRVRRRTEYEKERRWGLKVLLAEISAKAESLAQEVGAVRQQWSIDSLPEDARELPPSERRRLQSAHQKRQQEILTKHCLTVVRSLMNHKWAFPFNHKVDVDLYKDYLSVVKVPMDLTTIRKKLEQEIYRTPEEFAEDTRLVFSNAKLYNPAGSDVFVMASTLQEKFEEKWLTVIVGKLNDEEATRVAEEAAAMRRRLEQAQAKVIESMEGQRQSLIRQIESLESWLADAKSRAAAACLPLTSEEKDALVEAISNIDYGHREAIGTIVRSRYPELQDGEVMTVPLDCLDALTLRQLQHYARSAKRANQSGGEEAGDGGTGGGGAWGRAGGSPQQGLPGAVLGVGLRDPSSGRSLKRSLSGAGIDSNRSDAGGTPNAMVLGGLGRSRLSRPPLPPSKMAPRLPYPPGSVQPPPAQAFDRQNSSGAPGGPFLGSAQVLLHTQGSGVGPGALPETGNAEPQEAPQNELDRSASSVVTVSEMPSLGAWALNISQAMSAQAQAASRPAILLPPGARRAQGDGSTPMEFQSSPFADLPPPTYPNSSIAPHATPPVPADPMRPGPPLYPILEESGIGSSEGKTSSGPVIDSVPPAA